MNLGLSKTVLREFYTDALMHYSFDLTSTDTRSSIHPPHRHQSTQ